MAIFVTINLVGGQTADEEGRQQHEPDADLQRPLGPPGVANITHQHTACRMLKLG